MERTKTRCMGTDARLADLLLNPGAASAKVRAHVEHCDSCAVELAELRATMALLDEFAAPEPNPYFLTRLDAQMREERASAPQGWFARLRDRIAYGPQSRVRPLAAMALTVVLLLGGGTYLGITDWDQPPALPSQAAVVHDLQTLDNNAQLLDELESISGTNNGD